MYSIKFYNSYPIYSVIYANQINTDNLNVKNIYGEYGEFDDLKVNNNTTTLNLQVNNNSNLNNATINNLTCIYDANFQSDINVSKNINCDLDIYCRDINASRNANITKKLDIGDNLIVGPSNTLTTNSLYNIINGQSNNNETNTGDYINNSTIIGRFNKVNNIKDSLVIGYNIDLSNLAFYNNFQRNIVSGQNHQIQSSGNGINGNIIGGDKLITNSDTKNMINNLIMCKDTEIYGVSSNNGIFGEKHKLNLDTNNIGNISNLISGYHNILTNCYYNNIGGANNTLTQSNYNNISGNSNGLTSSVNNIIGGNNNKASNINNSLIIGKNYNLTNITSSQNFQNNILSGSGSTFRNGGTSISNNIISGNNITTYSDTQNMESNLIMSDHTRIRGKTKNNLISGWFHDLQKDDNNYGITGNLITGYQDTLKSVDFNLIGGHTQTVVFSYQNIIEGKYNKIYNSQNSLFIGENFDLSNTNSSRIFERNILSGYAHIIKGKCSGNIIGGNSHTLDIGSSSDSIFCNIICGNFHTLKYAYGNAVNGNHNSLDSVHYNNVSGGENTITSASNYNNISGQSNTITSSTHNNISGFNNILNSGFQIIMSGKSNNASTTATKNNSIISGNGNIINSSLSDSLIIGSGNTISSDVYRSFIGGSTIVISSVNENNIIFGKNISLATSNSVQPSCNLILGYSLSLTPSGFNQNICSGVSHNISGKIYNSFVNGVSFNLGSDIQTRNSIINGDSNSIINARSDNNVLIGNNNKIDGNYLSDGIVLGKFNEPNTTNPAYLIVGNGSDDNNRKNDFVIYKDGNTYTKNLTINTSKTIINTTGPKISTHIDEDIITTKYYVDTHLPICLKVIVQWSYINLNNEWSYPTNTSNYMTISGNSLLSGNYIYITGLIPSPLAHPEPSGQNPNDKRIRINKIYMFNTPNGDLVGIPSNRYGGTFTSLCSLTNSLYGNSLLCFHLNNSAYDLSRENPIAGSYENDFTINENYSLWTFNIMNLEFLLQ